MDREEEVEKLFFEGKSASEISKELGVSYQKVRLFLLKQYPEEYKNPPRKIILERFQKEKAQKEDFVIAAKLGKDFPSSTFWKHVSFSDFSLISVKQLYTEKMQKWISQKWDNFSIKLPSKAEKIEFSSSVLLDTTNYEYSKQRKTIKSLFSETA